MDIVIAFKTFDKGVGLAGALMGQQVLGSLVAQCARPSEPTRCFLDFEGVSVATASFVRACVVGFRDYTRQQNPNLYPVVANASADLVEDLQIVLESRSDAIAVCDRDADGTTKNARVIGRLEIPQQETLNAVQILGVADATSLHRQQGAEPKVKTPTAWNNRLAVLVAKGLLIEVSRGRAKSYRCVLPELSYGS